MVELSFSRVQSYLRCPWLYHLVYDLGWRSGPTGSAALGQSLHRALAAFLSPDNTDRSFENLSQIFDEVWVNEGFSDTGETLDVYERGQKMLKQFFESESKCTSTVLATEKEFQVALSPTIQFRGTVDRLDKTAEGFEIVEYKTHGESWKQGRTESDLQMTLYALGLRETHKGSPLKLKYHFLSSGEVVETTRTEGQIADAAQLLSDVAVKIQDKDFTPNHTHCSKCEFVKRCEKSAQI